MEPVLKNISMRLHPASESGLFAPRAVAAFVLCSVGIVLGMFSVTATPPPETTRARSTVPPALAKFPSAFGRNDNRLPLGVPLPPGAQFSPDGPGGPLGNSTLAGFAGFGRMPVQPGRTSDVNSLGISAAAANQNLPPSTSPPATTWKSTPLASGAQSGDWSIVNSPNDSATPYFLIGVSCVSTSDCWAVGRSAGISKITIIEHWNGASWVVVPSPDGPGDLINILSGVACSATNNCWAVGYYVTQSLHVGTLILQWDGSSWAIVPSPDANAASRSALYSITCPSGSECWAVGFDATTGSFAQTLIERWDGSSWTVVASPNASATQGNELLGVTCLSTSNCWAVGSYLIDSSTRATLTERWDGSAWTVVTSPSAVGAQESVLNSVTCESASDCWAVGNNGIDIVDPTGTAGTIIHVAQTLIERWDGTSWTLVSSPNPSVDNFLASVTCTSSSACWAVGYSSNNQVDSSQVDQSLILVWNGTVWLQNTAASLPTNAQTLAGVTCVSGADCWAVGSLTDGWAKGLINHWNGTSWSTLTAPKVDGKPSNFLHSVTCSSNSNCWAVGFWFADNVARTLIMRWDGTSWSIISSPNVNDVDNHYLGGVTCVSASDCWAVGSRTDNIGLSARTLILHWDGTLWSIVPSASDTSAVQGLDLEAVSCASATECLAVGFSRGNAGDYGFAMRWDGTSWSVVPVPPTPEADMFYTPSEYLYGVTCPAPSDCWAAGAHWTGTIYRTLLDHWDGSTWTAATSPNTAADQDNILSAVTCVSSAACWAVGSSDAYSQSLIERWNGTSWSIVPSLQGSDPLNAVTCLSASDCWAAGPYYTPNPPAKTLMMHWDGTSWSKVVSPNTSATQSNTLSGIACASPSECWAVGEYSSKGSLQTLTLHYMASPPLTPISIVSRKTHGTAGNFDIDLPLTGTPGIECRSGGENGDHTVVLTFATPVTFTNASVSSGAGRANGASTSSDGKQITVKLTGVTNAQRIAITLTGVSDGSNTGDVTVPMSILAGDTNADGFVNSGDIAQTKSQSGVALTNANFREDVTLDGSLNSGDIALVKSKSGTALP